MDLNTIALWLGAMPAVSLFVRSARAPHRPLGWMLVTALVLLASAAGWVLFRDCAGYVAAGLSLLFIVLPSWAANVATRASNRFEYRKAHRFFTLAALLHPLDGWPSMSRLFEAYELAHQGKPSEAEALLRVLAAKNDRAAALAHAQRLRLLGRWRELRALLERAGLSELRRDPALLVIYLRALGELGESEALAEFMIAQESVLTGTGALAAAFLYLFAFTGQVELTEKALGVARYTEEARDFWLAIARKCHGDLDEARLSFARLQRASDAQIRARAEDYVASLRHAAMDVRPSQRTLEIVHHFARLFAQREQLLPSETAHRGQRRGSQLIIAINCVVYAVGSYPALLDTRADFGDRWAFYAPQILDGEWWRAFSYFFVHANWLHLVMNMAGLWALGPFVERAFGRLRAASIYFAAGGVGSVIYLALTAAHWIEAEQLVGASGCIMGLLGAMAAVMLRAWIRERASIARQIFLRLLAVVALQVAFDLSTPHVAGLAHALGLLGGFVTALLLRERVSPARSVATLGS